MGLPSETKVEPDRRLGEGWGLPSEAKIEPDRRLGEGWGGGGGRITLIMNCSVLSL